MSHDDDNQIDQQLIHQIAQQRDRVAMERLYLRYRPRLGGFLRRLTDDDGLIEEVYNDVMFKVWEKAHQYGSRSKVSSWIFSIGYRQCLRIVKKQANRSGILNMLLPTSPNQSTDLGTTIEERDLIHRALARLPAKHRIVVELCYFEGRSTKEIGEIVNCPSNTVKTRLHHARKKIREFVESAEKPPVAQT